MYLLCRAGFQAGNRRADWQPQAIENPPMKKQVIVLGSTGSIGRSTIEVLAGMADDWEVVGLAAGSRWKDLADQAGRLQPRAVAITDDAHARSLKSSLNGRITVYGGHDALVRLVDEVACDCVVSAVVGAEGLPATLRAVEKGRRIALANKETLVVAGSILMPLAEKTGAEIIPIDSEHSAIFQALQAGRSEDVRKVYLTSSGGPFRTNSMEEMDDITLEDALRHPTWEMGPKITIDSATMMNKALEIVEAKWLFGLESEQIEVVIHPESILHSFVEFCDGALIAQLGTPDMRTPIQYALTYPQRRACPSKRLNLSELRQLSFHPPDTERFPALRLGHEVASRGGTCGVVLNAANEAAVRLFRDEAIHYRDIARITERVLTRHEFHPSPTWEQLMAMDRWARDEVARCAVC